MVETALDADVAELVIERDESTEQVDRRLIAELIRRRGAHLRYRHASPHEHPLLWVSDAVAWCTSHGGDWSRRARSLVGERVCERWDT